MNWWRLLVMRDPKLGPHAKAFDALLAQTPPGESVDYEPALPKWWFLHHLVRAGFVLHGSNENDVEEFQTRPNFDAHNENHVEAVFATDDAIWPLYFAVVRRPQSLINWCEHVDGASRYLFSIGADPGDPASWTPGTVYVLPRETFSDAGDPRADQSRACSSAGTTDGRSGRLPVQACDPQAPPRKIGPQRGAAERPQVAATSLILTDSLPSGRLVIQIR